MNRIELDGWILECDVEATRRAYEKIPLGDPEQCGCLACRNFVAVRTMAYPKTAVRLYERLGIRTDREAETYRAGPSEEGGQLYGGWHHFVGRVLQDPGTAIELTESFSVWFHASRACAEPVFGDAPLVQVEFFTTIPWVLEEPPEREIPEPEP